jgi:FAD:protein FMN transferase
MWKTQFEAIGTHWWIGVEDEELSADQTQALSHIENICREFETKWSRFLPESDLSLLNKNQKSRVEIEPELGEMLAVGQQMHELTRGAFNVNLGSVLEGHGYDAQYSFKKNEEKLQKARGSFSVTKKAGKWVLERDGFVQFDLGGVGKGYLIDKIATWLQKQQIRHFLIDGGGDIFGTVHKDGRGWNLGLQHYGDLESVIGQVELKNSALAGSGSYRRRVGEFHHLLDSRTKKPTSRTLAVFVTGTNALMADVVATALSVSDTECWPILREKCEIEYCVVLADESLVTSPGWQGELFT